MGIVFADFACKQHAAVMHYEERIDPRHPTKANTNLPEPYFENEGFNEVYVDRASVVPLF